jgi:hypothetical protein
MLETTQILVGVYLVACNVQRGYDLSPPKSWEIHFSEGNDSNAEGQSLIKDHLSHLHLIIGNKTLAFGTDGHPNDLSVHIYFCSFRYK